MIKKLVPKLLLCIMLAWFALPGALQAALEPTSVTIEGLNTGSTPNMVPDDDFGAVVEAPTSGIVGYTLDSYVATWNTSNAPLDDTQLNSVSYTEKAPHSANIVIPVERDTFAGSDGVAWYLHVKTVYYATGNPEVKLSDDFITQYTFDDVAPVGSIALDETNDNQTATTSTSSKLILSVPGNTDDIDVVYVNTSNQFSTAEAYDFSDSATTTLEYTVEGEGEYTLYAWFEDLAGNISSEAKTLSVKVIAGKSMQPAENRNLEVGGSLTFQIDGAADGETFTWTIVDATSGDPSTAAVFDPAAPTGATATVKGATEGDAVIVKATSDTDGKSYNSGTISIIQSGYTITHNYVSGLNLVPFSLSGTGITNASDLRDAVETANSGVAVSQIFGWDIANQRYMSAFVVIAGTGYFDFELVEGAAYFVQTDSTATLQIQGNDFISVSVKSGLNLLSVPYGKAASITTAADFDQDISNSTGLEVSQIFGWDADNQRYQSAYVVLNGTGYFDFNLNIGSQGYFVQLSGDGTYTP